MALSNSQTKTVQGEHTLGKPTRVLGKPLRVPLKLTEILGKPRRVLGKPIRV